MRVVNRFQVFEDGYISAFCDQGGARQFAVYAGDRIFFLRVTNQVRCRADCLRIERARGLHFTRRVDEGVLCFAVDEGFRFVIGGVFRFAGRPQVGLDRVISAIGHVSLLRDLYGDGCTRIDEVDRFFIRIVGDRIVVACGSIRALPSRAGSFLSSLFGEAASERSFARQLRA